MKFIKLKKFSTDKYIYVNMDKVTSILDEGDKRVLYTLDQLPITVQESFKTIMKRTLEEKT